MKTVIGILLIVGAVWVSYDTINGKINPHHSLKRAIVLIWEGH
jgi:hypothetical protein